MAGIRRVIVGVSGSPGSVRALRYAAQVACDDEVSLIAVLAWVPPGGDLAERRSPSLYLRDLWQEAASQRLTEALAAAWGDHRIERPMRRIIARGEPGTVLVSVADEPEDLIVVGAGEQAPVKRLWHGRVARYCLAHASCPVLAIPPSPLVRQAQGLRRLGRTRRRLDPGELLRGDQQPTRREHGV